jgi:hypothetical protein
MLSTYQAYCNPVWQSGTSELGRRFLAFITRPTDLPDEGLSAPRWHLT